MSGNNTNSKFEHRDVPLIGEVGLEVKKFVKKEIRETPAIIN